MTDPDKGRRKGRGRGERDEVPNEEFGWIADLRQARESGDDLGAGGRGSDAPASSRWDVLGAELGPDADDAPPRGAEPPTRAARRATADRASAERASADRASAERASADRASAERASADRASVDRGAAGRAPADRAGTDRAEPPARPADPSPGGSAWSPCGRAARQTPAPPAPERRAPDRPAPEPPAEPSRRGRLGDGFASVRGIRGRSGEYPAVPPVAPPQPPPPQPPPPPVIPPRAAPPSATPVVPAPAVVPLSAEILHPTRQTPGAPRRGPESGRSEPPIPAPGSAPAQGQPRGRDDRSPWESQSPGRQSPGRTDQPAERADLPPPTRAQQPTGRAQPPASRMPPPSQPPAHGQAGAVAPPGRAAPDPTAPAAPEPGDRGRREPAPRPGRPGATAARSGPPPGRVGQPSWADLATGESTPSPTSRIPTRRPPEGQAAGRESGPRRHPGAPPTNGPDPGRAAREAADAGWDGGPVRRQGEPPAARGPQDRPRGPAVPPAGGPPAGRRPQDPPTRMPGAPPPPGRGPVDLPPSGRGSAGAPPLPGRGPVELPPSGRGPATPAPPDWSTAERAATARGRRADQPLRPNPGVDEPRRPTPGADQALRRGTAEQETTTLPPIREAGPPAVGWPGRARGTGEQQPILGTRAAATAAGPGPQDPAPTDLRPPRVERVPEDEPAADRPRRGEQLRRQASRTPVLALALAALVLLVGLPVVLLAHDAGTDPAFAELDRLQVPTWAAQSHQDTSTGSRWCVSSCRLRDRTWRSAKPAQDTDTAFRSALVAAGWQLMHSPSCPLPASGTYTCWLHDKYQLDLWTRDAPCDLGNVAPVPSAAAGAPSPSIPAPTSSAAPPTCGGALATAKITERGNPNFHT